MESNVQKQTETGSGGVHPSQHINHGNTKSNMDHTMKPNKSSPTRGGKPDESGEYDAVDATDKSK